MPLGTDALQTLAEPSRRAQWERLGALLKDCDYRTAQIGRLLRPDEPQTDETILLDRGKLAAAQVESLAADLTPVSTLTQLFFFSAPVSRERYGHLPASLRACLEDLSCVTASDPVEPTVTICELRSQYFVSDLHFRHLGRSEFALLEWQPPMEPVTAINASSLETLENIPIPGEQDSLLDVGCGSGCLSILVGSRSGRVWGIDTNPRAIAYSRVNAMLNRDSARFVQEDCLNPEAPTFAGGERFTCVAFNANPTVGLPFIERSLGSILAPGGSAHVWQLLLLTESTSSPAALVVREAPQAARHFVIEARPCSHSRFRLTREQLESGDLPADYPLLQHPGPMPRPGRKDRFLAHLRQRGVIEVCSTLLNIRHPSDGERPGCFDVPTERA